MIQHHTVEPRFVKTVPRQLEPGVLYVSVDYGTVVHACCCGCGQEVVTPLTPTDWRMTYDGETVSLWPSVGSWNLPCQSHYVIDRNVVIEQGRWGRSRIEAEQRRDKAAKNAFFSTREQDRQPAPPSVATNQVSAEKPSFWSLFSRIWK